MLSPTRTFLFAFASCLLISHYVRADLYNLISYDSEQDGAVLSGFIETDGSLILSQSSILSWSYTIDKGSGNIYSLTSSDTDTQAFLESGSTLFVDNGTLKLDGLLRLGRYFGNSGGNETALNWASSGATKLYDSVREGNASPWGWASVNPTSLGASPWAIAAIPEPSVMMLISVFGSALLIYNRVFRRKPMDSLD